MRDMRGPVGGRQVWGGRVWAAALVACLGAAAPAPAEAATLYGATSLHVFGDSLSDRGRVFGLTAGAIPESPPYWRGRFSNGRVWAERLERDFRAAGLPTSNQAYGGAKAATDRDGIPDLGLQALAYRRLSDARKGDAPMAAIWAGGNDVMGAAGGDRVRRVGRAAADAVTDTARLLSRFGVERVLILNLPDVGRIPRYADDPRRGASASGGAAAFNARLDRNIRRLRADGVEVRRFDAFAAVEGMFDDPASFGVRDVTRPCLRDDRPACSRAQARRKAFFDEIHPTARVHAKLAALIRAELRPSGPARIMAAGASPAPAGGSATPSPVPLPPAAGLLLAGLAALGGLARLGRRRAG